ncbi:4-hydroxythreonine-4-phosphate dehydrogenase PdxA [Hoeflea sp. WL0058]|uniref:4-hydroxythreonine-4-phosphate dehydrogenase n=1 Tax=Flavimaribacter sediminis TaxID=2865987 RepID=A0AAE2ZMH4_9HYPH|nr:4-hydroxythreonine-4-phosphate dehydrogenase PdxA [Flavimaribacter sediminis]MBW8639634.1 4-hydroxythreonine-4-phosphate dehydrogenase PdxA [Flavimaribacter sediminis]
MKATSLPLVVTMGDPAGIGPDITIDLWRRRAQLDLPPFAVLGSPTLLAERAKLLNAEIAVSEIDQVSDVLSQAEALPVLPLENQVLAKPGKPDRNNAEAILEAIRRAVDLTMSGKAAAIVTNPIAKAILYDAGFGFPGHTEYLAELAKQHTDEAHMPVMMLAGPDLNVVPVTIHIPLRKVPEQLTTDLIVETGLTTSCDLESRFGISKPRIAVAGLNPHAGESGSFGSEDLAIIAPAIAEMRAQGVNAFGPLPADTMFHAEARRDYDAALCMYHDQALIPAKALAFNDTVNTTLGLPFIRTSPDHGTAFDIAGSGKAHSGSLLAAMKLAARMAAHQRKQRHVGD